MRGVLALDCESHAILPGLLAPPLVCVSFCEEGHAPYLLDAREGAAAVYVALSEGRTLVGANIAYDAAVLCAFREDLIPLFFEAYSKGLILDVQIREQILDIAQGRIQQSGAVMVFDKTIGGYRKANYSLAGLESKYMKRDRSAEKHDPGAWRLRYGELDGVPLRDWPEDAVRYAKEDAEGTLAVYLAQGGDIPTEKEQCRAAFALHLMSCWGMRTDKASVDALEIKLLAAKKKNDKYLHAAGFFKQRRATREEVAEGKIDFWEAPKKEGKESRPIRYARDMEAISSYVTRAYNKRLKRDPPMTESGRVATDKDTLQQAGSRLLHALADGGGVDKILQTYLPALKQGTEVPINARFHVLVNSSRTSCSKPNLQNLPTGRRVGGVRECFVFRPGFLGVSVDYNMNELLHLAQRCLLLFKRSRMAEALKADKDLHIVLAAQILRMSYEEAYEKYKAGDPKVKNARDLAKVGNFGLPGGLGAATLVEYARASFGVVMTEMEARKLKDNWFSAFPEMRWFFDHVNSLVGLGDARLTDPVTGYVRGGMGYTDACNHQFQHPAAMGAKEALFRVAYECYVDRGTALYGSRPVAFIHDEIVAEVPEAHAHEASFRLAQVMCEANATIVKDIPVKAVPALMRRWYKNAKEVFDATGRLVPWNAAT